MCMVEFRCLIISFISICLFSFSQASSPHDEFVEVVSSAKQAVVIIETTRPRNAKQQTFSVLGETAGFFKDELKEISSDSQVSRGTGFIIDSHIGSKVSILTAAHVVKKASTVNVLFSDGSRGKADIVWSNKKNDIALLEVEISGELFQPLLLSKKKVIEGQQVLSISVLHDLSVSSSLGIVSGVDVFLRSRKAVPLIQTDAAATPSSSGGALLDSKGRVVGLISSVYTRSGNFSGIAFAIPATVIEDLIASRG